MNEEFNEQELSVGCLRVQCYQVRPLEFETRPPDFQAYPLTHYAILPDVYIYATDLQNSRAWGVCLGRSERGLRNNYFKSFI